MGLKENIDRMQEMSRLAEFGGGVERLEKQRKAGRMTARERIDFLLDRGSW
jgi:propionyl-CoA carboxylase beta chain